MSPDLQEPDGRGSSGGDTRLWTVVLVVGILLVGIRWAFLGEMPGKEYVRAVPQATWVTHEPARQRDYVAALGSDPAQTEYAFSPARTVGLWVAAFFTLAVLSFLYRDNPFYKVAEAVVVGVSAAYWMVTGFWTTLIPNLLGKLSPDLVKSWANPGLDEEPEYFYIVPLVLGVMLLWRLAPAGAWIARWPLAFFIGVFCGIRLTGFLHGDFLAQIRSSIMPLVVIDRGTLADGTPFLTFDPWQTLRHLFIVGGVLTCLVYFFFSFEHKGIVGRTARVGIWVLMITFGAGFGYTVMGRIALLAQRLEFLFDDWLWLVDPTEKRLLGDAASWVAQAGSWMC
jgi:hypothetical protein